MHIVVAVSGPPGAGKTTLIQNLLRRIPSSIAIYSDDYESYTQKSPEEMKTWLANSGDPSDFDLSDLVADLRLQKYGPGDNDASATSDADSPGVIFFETQFGRRHAETGQFIDCQIWIEMPADVALARNIQVIASKILAGSAYEHTSGLDWVYQFCKNYTDFVRDLLVIQKQWISPDADIVVDGILDANTASDLAAEQILSRCSL